MTRFINLTKHNITLILTDGMSAVTIHPMGLIARCATDTIVHDTLPYQSHDIELRRHTFGGIFLVDMQGKVVEQDIDLHEWPIHPDTYYIVSRFVAEAVPERTDFLIPDGVQRVDDGNIIGCTGFATLTEVDA